MHKQKSAWKGNGNVRVDFENTELEVLVGHLGGSVRKNLEI